MSFFKTLSPDSPDRNLFSLNLRSIGIAARRDASKDWTGRGRKRHECKLLLDLLCSELERLRVADVKI